MATITIRNLDDRLKQRLRVRAAEHGHSMEEEARAILRAAVAGNAENLAGSIRRRVSEVDGVDLEIPAREAMREPVRFD